VAGGVDGRRGHSRAQSTTLKVWRASQARTPQGPAPAESGLAARAVRRAGATGGRASARRTGTESGHGGMAICESRAPDGTRRPRPTGVMISTRMTSSTRVGPAGAASWQLPAGFHPPGADQRRLRSRPAALGRRPRRLRICGVRGSPEHTSVHEVVLDQRGQASFAEPARGLERWCHVSIATRWTACHLPASDVPSCWSGRVPGLDSPHQHRSQRLHHEW
jgi:hypothetical protein